jgi:hypothetical protein
MVQEQTKYTRWLPFELPKQVIQKGGDLRIPDVVIMEPDGTISVHLWPLNSGTIDRFVDQERIVGSLAKALPIKAASFWGT